MAKTNGIGLMLPVEVTRSIIEKGIRLGYDLEGLSILSQLSKKDYKALIDIVFTKFTEIWGEDFAISFFAKRNFDPEDFVRDLSPIDLATFVSRY